MAVAVVAAAAAAVVVQIGDSLVEHVGLLVFQGGAVGPLQSPDHLVDNVVGDGCCSGGEDTLHLSSYFPLYL